MFGFCRVGGGGVPEDGGQDGWRGPRGTGQESKVPVKKVKRRESACQQ